MRMTDDDGHLVIVPPGQYTLLEAAGARYQLSGYAVLVLCLSLWFAEVLLCAYMGQLEILGVWP